MFTMQEYCRRYSILGTDSSKDRGEPVTLNDTAIAMAANSSLTLFVGNFCTYT